MKVDPVNKQSSVSPNFALTPMQLGMVYESALARRPWVNLEQIVVHLDDEEITPDALSTALTKLAARHDALRLRIQWSGREHPLQSIDPTTEIDLTVTDWQDLTEAQQDEALARFLEADRERGVDLETAPSWRIALHRLGPRRSVLVWTIHHALVDGRSMAIVLEDLFSTLGQSKRRPVEHEAPARLAEFCATLNGKGTAAAKAFFCETLDGFDQPNALTDPDAATPGQGRKVSLERILDAGLTAALGSRAEKADVTLATVVHAAWGLVVARWSGRADAVFGVTRSGRYIAPESGRLVGCLINTLPARIDTSVVDSIDDLFTRLRAQSLEVRRHEHASLTDIRQWTGLPPTAPLFESMVMFERASLTETMRRVDRSWQNRRIELHEEGALPLTLAVYADPCMKLVLEHDPGLIPSDRAEAMLAHFTRLLAAMASAAPDTPLSALSMLSASEEATLHDLARPSATLPAALPCMATRFEERVASQPGAQALAQVGREATLDFQSLDHRANGLAHRLLEHGAAPGEIVALCLDRSQDFVVALLAVLKTGAAFLPIDPAYPPSVTAHMLADSAARLMIAVPDPDHPDGLTVLPPDAPACAVAPQRPPPDPDRLAYVIYTSGSTGTPKGVRVPQRAVSAHASAIIDAFGLTPNDRCLQFAGLSFDVSIEEILPSLIAGATVVMRDAEMAQSVSAFLGAVETQRLTVLNLPTAFWHILVDDMARSGRALPGCVRLVIVGGERINPRSLATWQRLAPSVRWLNGYGPTETTITCTLHAPGPANPAEEIPIGRPTLHARAYVLAADGSLAPRGCPGDLWIGGEAVSDGYLGRATQTADAFRPDPFAGQGRMYRTGDRACWREDGTLAFLGRQDRQVKLRGFRIDLRHVEAVLEREDGVGRALARVLDADSPGARLVAWVTGTGGGSGPDVDALADAAARNLAAHMVPAIVAIAEFPRTPGGKIDTAALPESETRAGSRDDPTPMDAQTRELAQMMARVLRLDAIGPDDSFHDLGGHSLLAVQLIGQIETAFGLRLSVGDLHRNPTPRALSAAIEAAQIGPRFIIPIQPDGPLPPLFGVHVLGHNEVYYRPLAQLLGADQPVLGLTVGLLAEDTPIGVEATARSYFEDLQTHYPEGPVSLAAVSLGSYIAFELARQLHAAGREVRMLALFDAEGPAGRSQLTGSARLLAHARLLRIEGIAYVRRILANRLADLKNRIAKARVRKATSNGKSAPLTLPDFVAANELAARAYDAQPLPIPLTIFRAESDVFDSPLSRDNGLGWATVAGAGFEMIDIPGDHLGILQPPNVAHMAPHLRRAMARSQADQAPAPRGPALAGNGASETTHEKS